MKKRLFVILSLLVALLPANGQLAIVNDSTMFISQQVDSLTEAERYFNPLFLVVAKGKEHLKQQLVRGSICDCDTTIPNRRIGVFSVAPDKQVSFSQGNLQYFPAAKLWKFADNQYDYLGNANKYLSPTFRNWVDLFGWSANNTTAPFGVSTSTNVADYAGDFVDWGNNWICGDVPGTWRTLSADEWEYLFEKREKALQLRSKGSIDGHRGHILLPDDWVLPDGVHFVAEPNNLTMDLDINSYTQAEWRIMEEAGAIFLPAAGRRDGTTVGYLVEYSGVWSSTSTTNTNAYHSYYNYESQVIEHHWTSATSRMNGRSVRLVHDTIVPKVEPEYVDLGLSVKWATFNVGASKPEEYGDYFAWGETQPKEEYTWENYKWCDGAYTKLNKYCTKEQYGTLDNLTTLHLTDDAAHTNWKGNWRMPSSEEAEELISQCTWTWTTINGISGHQITGPNGNSIFLPATGAITKDGLQHAGSSGYYWINSISMTTPYNANDIYNRPPNTEMDGSLPTFGINAYSRYIGRPIRPVYDDTPKSNIIWYSNEAIKGEGKAISITNKAGFAYLHPKGEESTELNRHYQGKRINCIRLQVAKEGTFTVSVADRDRLDSLFNPQTITLKEPSKKTQVYHLPQTIHLQKNQVLVFAQPTDEGKFYYSMYIGDITYYGLIGQKEVYISKDRKTLHIDAGYYCEDGDNCDTLAIPEPEYVDLGLSVKWATFNVGATSPEEYGDYFAWGETQPKEEYSLANYKWEISSQYIKYNATDGKERLEPEDDAAYIHWGNNWRMPNDIEYQELIDKCSWEWTTINNINGYRITGPNGNSIFFPAASYKGVGPNYPIGEYGLYWSQTLNTENCKLSNALFFTSTTHHIASDSNRYLGRTIRPVYNETPDPYFVVKINDTLSINMAYVEGGTFTMGAMEGDTQANANEKPAHQVTLNYDYYMAQTEVTQALWKTVMGNDNNPSAIKGDNLPVNNVLWEEAQAFVEKLSQTTGQNFYLPTEAEWEYAARGGKKSKGYLYAGSNKVDEVAWYNSNSGGVTHPVAQKMPNELGIYDMSGNVWEWCSDWLAPYTAEAQLNPTGPATGECHVYHGGGWAYGQNFCRSSHRRQTVSGYVQQALGLRVVMRKK